MGSIEAQVIDEKHLKLLHPIQISPGSKIMITLKPTNDVPDDHELWYKLSLQGLEAAFSDNEPEYSTVLIKNPNPDFCHELRR